MSGKELGQQAAFAFPDGPGHVYQGEIAHSGGRYGLTKREYFAVLAMQGHVTGAHHLDWLKGIKHTADMNNLTIAQAIAQVSLQQADSLLEELAKEL